MLRQEVVFLILWIQLLFMDFSNWSRMKGRMKDIISVMFLAKSSLLPGWRTHPSVDSPVIQSTRSWLHNFSDVHGWVEGHPGRWGLVQWLSCYIDPISHQLGGCLFRLSRDLCRTGWEMSNPHASPVPGIVWGAASVTPLQPLVVPVMGGIVKVHRGALGFIYVLLLFAFCSEDAGL